jgi:hypothetical protein
MLIPGMIEMRVDMIVVACALVKFLLEKHSFNRIRVSTYSLKEAGPPSADGPHIHLSLHPIRTCPCQAKDRLRSGMNMLAVKRQTVPTITY